MFEAWLSCCTACSMEAPLAVQIEKDIVRMQKILVLNFAIGILLHFQCCSKHSQQSLGFSHCHYLKFWTMKISLSCDVVLILLETLMTQQSSDKCLSLVWAILSLFLFVFKTIAKFECKKHTTDAWHWSQHKDKSQKKQSKSKGGSKGSRTQDISNAPLTKMWQGKPCGAFWMHWRNENKMWVAQNWKWDGRLRTCLAQSQCQSWCFKWSSNWCHFHHIEMCTSSWHFSFLVLKVLVVLFFIKLLTWLCFSLFFCLSMHSGVSQHWET